MGLLQSRENVESLRSYLSLINMVLYDVRLGVRIIYHTFIRVLISYICECHISNSSSTARARNGPRKQPSTLDL